jgi:hypothetical protein
MAHPPRVEQDDPEVGVGELEQAAEIMVREAGSARMNEERRRPLSLGDVFERPSTGRGDSS